MCFSPSRAAWACAELIDERCMTFDRSFVCQDLCFAVYFPGFLHGVSCAKVRVGAACLVLFCVYSSVRFSTCIY
jgi:hypothetical protein